jgi:hypothetical protein
MIEIGQRGGLFSRCENFFLSELDEPLLTEFSAGSLVSFSKDWWKNACLARSANRTAFISSRSIRPASEIADGIIENVKERLFTPQRLTTILEALLERQRAKNRAVEDRRAALAVELAATNEKLNRLYRAIEDGIVDPDAQLKERVDALKTQRDLAQASLDRIAVQADTRAMITRIGSPRSSSSCEKSWIPAIPRPERPTSNRSSRRLKSTTIGSERR